MRVIFFIIILWTSLVSGEELRKKIAVIDTGIDLQETKLMPYLCKGGSKDFTKTSLQDHIGHGTNVSWQIVKNLDSKEYCLVILKYVNSASGNDEALQTTLWSFSYAIEQHVILINYSSNGSWFSQAEKGIIEDAVKQNIKVVVAAGNEGKDLGKNCSSFPACSVKHKNFYPVGSLNKLGEKTLSSNYGGPIIYWARGLNVLGPDGTYMSGTSQAAAIFSGLLLQGRVK